MSELTTEQRSIINDISESIASLELTIVDISDKSITPGDRNMINGFISDTSKTLSEIQTKIDDIEKIAISSTDLAELKALKPILISIINQQKEIIKKLNS